jgi:Tol biopolymer transport system component
MKDRSCGIFDVSPIGQQPILHVPEQSQSFVQPQRAADGSNPINLTKNAAEDSDPAYSPDGRQIAFNGDWTAGNRVDNPDGDVEIFRMSASGGAQTQLTINAGFEYSEASWQPLR